MQIENRNTSELIPYEFNNKKHTESQVDRIANSISEFGFNQPLVIDEKNIILVGHGRFEAAKKLGMSEVPVVQKLNLTEAQKKAYRILDNKLNDSEWDFDHLKIEIENLEDLGFNLEPWGLEDLIPNAEADGVIEDDFEPKEADEPFIKEGDLIELGEHRLLCGDSSKKENIELLLGGERVQCIVTDPPYGVAISSKNKMLNEFQKAGRCLDDIADDDLSPDDLEARLLPVFDLIKEEVMAEDCTLLVTAPQGGELGMMMMMMMQKSGLKTRHVLMWKKNCPTFSMGRLDYDYQHEPILLTWGKRHKKIMQGNHRSSVWEIDKPRKCDLHPTMKPVELYANAYLNHSEKGDAVFDAYSGSGTAFIAADQLGRKCYGLEISPKFCQVIVERYKAHCERVGKVFLCKVNGEDVSEFIASGDQVAEGSNVINS